MQKLNMEELNKITEAIIGAAIESIARLGLDCSNLHM